MTKEGKLNIGLSEYQEAEWLAAIKMYGYRITDKSLLSKDQKWVLYCNVIKSIL